MNAKLYGEVLEKSISLIGEKPDQLEHISKEFGLERKVLFFTSFIYPSELNEFLEKASNLYLPNCSVTPAKRILRKSLLGDSEEMPENEIGTYARELFSEVMMRAFPYLSIPQREIMHMFYGTRFELYTKKGVADNIDFLKSTVKIINHLCDSDVSFTMPSAIGENNYEQSDVVLPFFMARRYSHHNPTNPLQVSSDEYRPSYYSKLTYGVFDKSDVPKSTRMDTKQI